MNLPRTRASTASSEPPTFTLGSALRWLGHDCREQCCYSESIDTMRASMWFIRFGRRCRPFAPQVRVVVDATEIGNTVQCIRHMIFQVNACTRHDGIEVRYEPHCVRGRAVSDVLDRVPVAHVPHSDPARLSEMTDPSEPELQALMEVGRW